uniref:Glycoside hydrolase family 38 N-terminal domain-containing protein n=1 Tax=Biomphalaria glabrata TaxID=6526 RepID=A0A2C9LDB6_BIOGL
MSILKVFVVVCLVNVVSQAAVVHKDAESAQITKVHIVFMNHLDVGYADGIDQDTGFIVQVLNRYMTEYFVRAINISRTLIQDGYTEKFVYTTHPWLVSLYLDCPNITLIGGPLKCPSKSSLELSDFTWVSILSQGITKAALASLKKYGIKGISVGVNPGTAPPDVPSPFVWKFSQKDEDGIMAFWIKGGYPLNPGPNPAQPGGLSRDKCVIADGLSEILCFAFRTDNTGPPITIQEVLGYYEILRAEFPGAELVASTFDNFVQALETVKSTLPVRWSEIGDTWIQGVASDPWKYSRYRAFVRAWENCEGSYHCNRHTDPRIQNMLRYLVKIPEHTWGSHGIIDFIAWTNEALEAARQSQYIIAAVSLYVLNVIEVLGYYEILRAEFPGAELVASTFDNFVQALETVKSTLPVRWSEIGDTWIQGVASDPWKYSRYRAFVRAWENCEGSYHCNRHADPRIQNMLRYLVKIPEHTWGSHGIIDFIAWTNEALEAARQTKPYQINEDTWREQRQFLDLALTALEDHPLVQSIQNEYEDLVATEPDLSEYTEASPDQDFYCPNGGIIRFASDGSLIRLYDPFNKKEWASSTSRIGQILYDTYVEQDFIDMAKLYNYVSGVGYDKPNMTDNAHPEKKRWEVTMLNLYKYIGLNFTTCVFWVKAVTKDDQTRTKYGAPKVFYIQYRMESSIMPTVNVTFLMLGKTTTRLPESISFGFQPVNQGYQWTLDKMSQYIDPCDVVLNGSQYVHGVKNEVNLLNEDNKGIQFFTRDVPIVNLGTDNRIDSPFPVPLEPFECSTLRNFSFNIYNNIWNTNYPMWYPFNQQDENFKAEFTISFIS